MRTEVNHLDFVVFSRPY